MVLFSQSLNGIAKINLELPLQFEVGILRGTRADHQEEGCPLDAQGPVCGPVSPPLVILIMEGLRIDDVVMEVDVVEEVLDQGVLFSVSLEKVDVDRGFPVAHLCTVLVGSPVRHVPAVEKILHL